MRICEYENFSKYIYICINFSCIFMYSVCLYIHYLTGDGEIQ